ncbi:MAG: carboxymuconolactone decarboxylase family protein [Gemmatimonadetes bacterium]|nr:carboxymuconolactone decarboxylase family protein [Gemmatimonadota bacterium]
MSRIRPVDATTTSPAAAEQLAVTRQMFGSVPNMFATAAQSAPTLAALNAFFAALGKAPLGGAVGEQVAIAVAQANGCGYCLSAHTAIGGMHRVSPANLAAARHGRSDDPTAQAAITLALEIVHTRGRVSDAALARARAAGLDDSAIVEVVGHVALNLFTNYLNNLADTAIDFPVVPLEQAA